MMPPPLKITPPESSLAKKTDSAPLPAQPASSPIFGILMVSAVVVGLAGLIFQSRIKAFFSQPHLPPAAMLAQVTALAPTLTKILGPAKVPLPPIPSHAFHVTSIALNGATRIAVIDGQQVLEGHAVVVPGQPGWKVVEIHDGSVVLDYLGNRVPCGLEAPLRKPLNDRLHSLN